MSKIVSEKKFTRIAALVFSIVLIFITVILPSAYSENNNTASISNQTGIFPNNATQIAQKTSGTYSKGDVGAVSIVNVQVNPSTVKVGDNFTITATLVNNSTSVINVHNDCLSPFSIEFDSHANLGVIKPCIYFAISLPLNPGENRTGTGPGSNLVYEAVEAGTANATLTYSYTVGNQSENDITFDSNPVSVSKSVQFRIYPSSNAAAVIPSPLAQIRSGILAKDIKCMAGLNLAFKADDGSPACVSHDVLAKLVGRGWAMPINTTG